jgi:hypothetical protein
MDWPGRAEEARVLARTLSSSLAQRDRLARLIQARAVVVWHALNDEVS